MKKVVYFNKASSVPLVFLSQKDHNLHMHLIIINIGAA
jgi:hypothetical protein